MIWLPVTIVMAGFAGTQRVWLCRLYEGNAFSSREIWPLTRSFIGRFVLLGAEIFIAVILPITVLSIVLYRAGAPVGVLIAANIIVGLVTDVLLTFVVPALALTTKSVHHAWRLGLAMIRHTWPTSAWYICRAWPQHRRRRATPPGWAAELAVDIRRQCGHRNRGALVQRRDRSRSTCVNRRLKADRAQPDQRLGACGHEWATSLNAMKPVGPVRSSSYSSGSRSRPLSAGRGSTRRSITNPAS